MDSKGQASSVFQLLISAVVALAILMVLFGVLNMANFNVNTQPAKAAQDILKSAYNSPASVQVAKRVTFDSGNKTFNVINLANSSGVGISKEQICLNKGDFADNSLFSDSTATVISYSGSSSKDVGLIAFCSTAKDLSENFTTVASALVKNDWDFGECCQGLDDSETCCVIGLTTAKQ